MAKYDVFITKHVDKTITVRVGKALEHISTDSKDRSEIFDAVKWALISKGVFLEDSSIVELMQGGAK